MESQRLSGWKLQVSKCFLIPQRIVLVILCALAVFNSYTMRVCLNVALTRMAYSIKTSSNTTDVCHFPEEKRNETIKINMQQFNWSSSQQGWIKSAFYYGYVVSHLPGGALAERYGGKHVLGLGMLWTAILTLLTPVVALGLDFVGIIVLRVMVGLGEGVTFPALNALLSDWVPKHERSRLGSLAFSGIIFGSIVANGLTGYLISWTRRWDILFYVFGVIALIWYINYQLMVYSYPHTHPFISDKELAYLETEIDKRQLKGFKDMPWKGILTNMPVISLIVAQIGHDWGLFTILNDLPKYMDTVLKFSVKKNGLLSALPHFFMWLTAMISACICDWLIKKGRCSIGTIRKIFTGIAGIGPGVFLVCASLSGCHRTLAVICFCAALGSMGCYYPGMRVNGLDLTHTYAGIVMALVNGIGTVSGIISPILIGYITRHKTLTEWNVLFWITFAILVATVIFYIIFGSGKVQDFNDENYVFPGCCKKKRTE